MFIRKKEYQKIINESLLELEAFCSVINNLISHIDSNLENWIGVCPGDAKIQNPIKDLNKYLSSLDILMYQHKNLINILSLSKDQNIKNKTNEISEKRSDFEDFRNKLELKILEDIKYKTSKESLTSNISLLDIINGNYTLSEKNIKILSLSFENFINQLEKLPMKKKKNAYTGLLIKYLQDVRSERFYLNSLVKEVADDLHHLPLLISRDFQDFDEKLFWEPIFNSISKKYLLSAFIEEFIY